jgi:hypothetical protein
METKASKHRAKERSIHGDLLDAFFRDGSLRDVPVDGTRSQLEAFATRLASTGWMLSVEGDPIDAAGLSRWTASEGVTLCVNAAQGGCELHLWSWSPTEPEGFFSEVDLAPREVNRGNIDVIAGALCDLADLLERPVHLIVENMSDAILAVAGPAGVIVDRDACSSWCGDLVR